MWFYVLAIILVPVALASVSYILENLRVTQECEPEAEETRWDESRAA